MNALLTPTRLAFDVIGVPEPQGSSKGFLHRHTGRVIVTSDNPDLKKWRRTIAASCAGLVEAPISEPVIVTLAFRLPRPPSISKRILYPAVRPDCDKLVRGCLDGLVEGGVLKDDSLVVDIVASKRYAGPGQQPGVHVEIEMLPGRA